MLQNAWKRSADKGTRKRTSHEGEVQKRLSQVRQEIADHVAKVDMRYTCEGDTFADIRPFWVPVCDGVKQVECQLPTSDCTLLNVIFQPGAMLRRHYHLAHRETIFVVEGDIEDIEAHVKVGANGVYVIPAGRPHAIYSARGALLNVLFHPKYLPDNVAADVAAFTTESD